MVFRFGVVLKFASCEEEFFYFTLEHYELELKNYINITNSKQ